MKFLYVFIGGIAVGLTLQMVVAQDRPGIAGNGIIQLNHVGIAVPDIDEAVAYYEQTLGFPEAFRVENAEGEATLVYVQVSESTFVELQRTNDNRPVGLNHFGLQVSDMDTARDKFIALGADVSEIRTGGTKSILSNVTDLYGHRIELSEYPPESLQGQFLAR